MKANAIGEAESQKLISKGTADARYIVAEQRAEAIRLIADALKVCSCVSFHLQGITKDATQYLIGVQYIQALQSIITKNVSCVLYMPLQVWILIRHLYFVQTDISGAAGRLN